MPMDTGNLVGGNRGHAGDVLADFGRTVITVTVATAVVMTAMGCGSDFEPENVVERLRFVGIRAERPEICPFGPQDCPEGTFVGANDVALLAIDPQGIVADGRHPDGPQLRDGHSLSWALCTFSFQGAEQKSPDCTAVPEMLLDLSGPLGNLSTMSVAGAALTTFENSGIDAEAETHAGGTADPYAVFEYTQNVGVAIASAGEREWGLKGITLSNRPAAEQNLNPVIGEITMEGVPLTYGRQSAEVETGYAYRIGWKIPDDSKQWYTIKSAEGPAKRQERLNLVFYSNAGSFSKDGHIDLWLENDEQNELFWRPPLEVPEQGLDATLVFSVYDWRGGVDWVWAIVRVVRGTGVSPR